MLYKNQKEKKRESKSRLKRLATCKSALKGEEKKKKMCLSGVEEEPKGGCV